MLDMGFLPALRRIASILPKHRQTMCFSATLEGSVAHLVRDYTKNPVRLAFGSTLKPCENVKSPGLRSRLRRKAGSAAPLARQGNRPLPRLRAHQARRRSDCLYLTRQGINAAMIHGDRSQSQRTAALEGFQKGRYRVLVATDLAARGIHVQDIAHVINYDLPEVAENFIHRVGRTGRAGGTGVASTLFSRDQRTELFQLERTLGVTMERMNMAGLPEADQPVQLTRKRQVHGAFGNSGTRVAASVF